MTQVYDAGVVVIGAGVVGLASAAAFARAGHEVIVIEQEKVIGSGVSSRNSEVIHAGIYYPPNSMKARMCSRGRDMLYEYCASRKISHLNCGKIIVATSAREQIELERILCNAENNDVKVRLIDGKAARILEPELGDFVSSAIISSLTGIVDSHGLMLSLLGQVEDFGGSLALGARVIGGGVDSRGLIVEVGGAEPTYLRPRVCVNAAGLSAVSVSRALGCDDLDLPKPRFVKGSYFRYMGPHPFSHLIYPIPHDGGLGVHLTFDLDNAARFGPDTEWLATQRPEALDYDVNPDLGGAFAEAVSRYWPGVESERLQPDYSGIRPKINGPSEPPADFDIRVERSGDESFLVNLFGIESPGLTASLAIAEHIVGEITSRIGKVRA